MIFTRFLKYKIHQLILQIGLIVILNCIFALLFSNFKLVFIIFEMLIIIISQLLSYYFEVIRIVNYYTNLKKKINNLEDKYLIYKMLEQPISLECEFSLTIINQIAKHYEESTGKYIKSFNEYKEYIETWVHEIKTPITAASLIAENNKENITEQILLELDHVNKFVEQTLYFARSCYVEKDYQVQKINLKTIIDQSIKNYSNYLIKSKFQIKINDVNYFVYTDPKWVEFILGQIINNSIKYRCSFPILSIYATQMEDCITLHIKDNGIGIKKCDIKRVFDKGFTGENGRQYKQSTGLGLYLCKTLCNKMGLNISIESLEQKYTQVNIIFPKSSFFVNKLY